MLLAGSPMKSLSSQGESLNVVQPTPPTTHQHFSVKRCASAKNPCKVGGWVYSRSMGVDHQEKYIYPGVNSLGLPRVSNHTLDNSLLNMPIGLSIGWGIAYRYVLPAAIGGWNCLSIPISVTNTFREICTIRVGYVVLFLE